MMSHHPHDNLDSLHSSAKITTCLSEEEIVDHIMEKGSRLLHDSWQEHLDDCPHCRHLAMKWCHLLDQPDVFKVKHEPDPSLKKKLRTLARSLAIQKSIKLSIRRYRALFKKSPRTVWISLLIVTGLIISIMQTPWAQESAAVESSRATVENSQETIGSSRETIKSGRATVGSSRETIKSDRAGVSEQTDLSTSHFQLFMLDPQTRPQPIVAQYGSYAVDVILWANMHTEQILFSVPNIQQPPHAEYSAWLFKNQEPYHVGRVHIYNGNGFFIVHEKQLLGAEHLAILRVQNNPMHVQDIPLRPQDKPLRSAVFDLHADRLQELTPDEEHIQDRLIVPLNNSFNSLRHRQ